MTAKALPIDVGQYIIDRFRAKDENITTLKLQKLVFYSQAFSLVWDDVPLFDEDFQAWINGPVVRSLFKALQGYYYCPEKIQGADVSNLTDNQKDTLTKVTDHYGDLTSYDLVSLSHSERPWRDARKGLNPDQPSDNIITKESMADFYISQVCP